MQIVVLLLCIYQLPSRLLSVDYSMQDPRQVVISSVRDFVTFVDLVCFFFPTRMLHFDRSLDSVCELCDSY